MKKILFITLALFLQYRSYSQSQEVQQLLLDVEKLTQFKQILSDLKKGYEIISTGYTTIRNISQGNFNLHKAFLDALLDVSPTVRNYKRIADIISLQLQLVREYHTAFQNFQSSGHFTVQEISYIEGVYSRLISGSLKNLDDLLTIVTAGQLRMSDDERLQAIDHIYADMADKIAFLRQFNNSTAILGVHRTQEQNDVDIMRKLYDISQ